MADVPEIADGGSGAESGLDLFAASLRASSGDLPAFFEVFADSLEQALPGRVQVERRAVRRFSREKRVRRIEVTLGDDRFSAVLDSGSVEARRAKAVRGVVLKSDTLPIDAWLHALGVRLAAEAEANEQSRRALEQILAG